MYFHGGISTPSLPPVLRRHVLEGLMALHCRDGLVFRDGRGARDAECDGGLRGCDLPAEKLQTEKSHDRLVLFDNGRCDHVREQLIETRYSALYRLLTVAVNPHRGTTSVRHARGRVNVLVHLGLS